MNAILVPTDFSPCATNALRFATRLKKPITLATAYLTPSAAAPVPLSFMQEEHAEQLTELNHELELLKAIPQALGLACELSAVEGLPADTIVNLAKKINADLIVMGSQGENTLSGAVLGSTATAVMENAPCPVLVVPSRFNVNDPIQKITFATAYATGDMQAIKFVAQLANVLNAQLSILHVAEDDEDYAYEKEKLTLFIDEVKKQINYSAPRFELLMGNAEAVMMTKMVAGDTDLIVLNSRHRSFWGRLFGHSLTRDLTMTTNIPLLAFHH